MKKDNNNQNRIPARPAGGSNGVKVTQEEIAHGLGLHPATVSKILNRAATDYTSVETRQKVFDLALKLGYDFTQLKSVQTRKNTRKLVDLPVRVIIVMISDRNKDTTRLNDAVGQATNEIVWDKGQARVCDISRSGALLADLQLSKNALPLQPFRLKLVYPERDSSVASLPQNDMKRRASEQGAPTGDRLSGGLVGIEIPCQVVRLSHTGSREGETHEQIKVGLKFETVPEETRNRLAELCSN